MSEKHFQIRLSSVDCCASSFLSTGPVYGQLDWRPSQAKQLVLFGWKGLFIMSLLENEEERELYRGSNFFLTEHLCDFDL